MELEKWRQKLLDIGKKNRLINYKDTKLSTTTILSPEYEKTFRLITSGQKCEIIPIDKTKDEPELLTFGETEETDYLTNQKIVEKYQKNIKSRQILMVSVDLMTSKTLSMIIRKSRSFLVDKGINILFMAFGMLKWESGSTKEHFLSPLILVPVKITSKSSLEPLKIELYEDEILVNPTLKYKLKEEYQLELPEFEEESLTDFFDKVQNSVQKLNWIVSKDIKLGMFSFLKMNMYVDLKDNEKLIVRNPLIMNLFGKLTQPLASSLNKEPIIFHNVVDADSSQLEAIKDAKMGKSFVLQGPPGTGKSQTITNIIADSLIDGKKILFVSEKIAALNIVYQNLVKADLGQFCLELHSYKANKKDVIEQFYQTMKIPPQIINEKANNELSKLDEYQKTLDQYVKDLHLKNSVIELSLYEIFNEISKLRTYNDIGYQITKIEKRSKKEFDTNLELLDNFISYVEDIGYDYRLNPWYGCNVTKVDYELKKEISQNLWNILNYQRTMQTFADEYNEKLDIAIINTKELIKINNEIEFLINFKYPNLIEFNKEKLTDQLNQIILLQHNAEIINNLKRKLEVLFKPSIYSISGKELLNIYQTKFKSSFRFLNKEYRQYNTLLTSHLKNKKIPYLQMIQYLSLLADIQTKELELNENAKYLSQILTKDYLGSDTDWDSLILSLKRVIDLSKLNISFEKLDTLQLYNQNKKYYQEIVLEINEEVTNNQMSCEMINKIFASDVLNLNMFTFEKNINKLSDLIQNIDIIEKWGNFNILMHKIQQVELADFLETCLNKKIDYTIIKEIFAKQYYTQWAHYIIDNNENIRQFNRNLHDKMVNKYIDKDILQFEISKAQIIDKLSTNRPNLDIVVQGSQSSILIREYQKKRNQMPVRQLLNAIDELAQTLKPCFLMSPLSVSTYLDPNCLRFDLVIFDEASQIFPWDAVGAIYRAKQVIIVGDSKQMPPTNFFNAGSGESQDEEEDTAENINDFESILDICSYKYPSRRLKWHYRSRSEQLISFSNQNFYNNELITFPSAYDSLDEYGICYHYVENGIFNRLTKTNLVEAEYVVDLVINHLKQRPDMSLGVVTFSQAQQDLVEQIIDNRKKKDQTLEEYFNNQTDAFFVKNLETVQGDERDAIIFSVGYAKDKEGKFYHNFGPLNRLGGERRLNVAITRAKYEMIVVSSIYYTDIDLSKTQAVGAKLLRDYLQYAMNNAKVKLVGKEDNAENEFPLLVTQFLNQKGFNVLTNVGYSNYKIDLVVQNNQTNQYSMAIECDGKNYLESRSTRDRERLRKEVLEKMGWHYYRIWSVDWMRNTSLEQKRLIDFINKCLQIEKNDHDQSDDKKDLKDQFIMSKRQRKLFISYQSADIDKLLKEYQKNKNFPLLLKNILMVEAPISIDYLLKKIIVVFNRVNVTNTVKKEFNEILEQMNIENFVVYRNFLYLSRLPLYTLRLPNEQDLIKRDVTEICIEELAGGMLELIKENRIVEKEGLYKLLAQMLKITRVTEKCQYVFDRVLKYLFDINKIEYDDNTIYLKK